MELFDVYPLYDITPVKGEGIVLTDDKNRKYLDFYGGHAVISIGHSHPHYIKRIEEQLRNLAFYSNSIINPVQARLARELGRISGCGDYQLFMCNSGAEANENALKLASFKTGKAGVISFKNSFHGRTSAAVAATDNPSIQAPVNNNHPVRYIPFDDKGELDKALAEMDACGVIFEAIQGVGGLDEPDTAFLQYAQQRCREEGVMLIADEVQSGFGRSGKFFAFQHHGIKPDIISMAKGMGNGFPVGGILIAGDIKPSSGMLGTTFGGNHLACAASLAVLEVLEKEKLLENAAALEGYFRESASHIPAVKRVKGRGLMLGLEFDFPVAEMRKALIYKQAVFTGGSANKKLLRFLPALNITKSQIDQFFDALKKELP